MKDLPGVTILRGVTPAVKSTQSHINSRMVCTVH